MFLSISCWEWMERWELSYIFVWMLCYLSTDFVISSDINTLLLLTSRKRKSAGMFHYCSDIIAERAFGWHFNTANLSRVHQWWANKVQASFFSSLQFLKMLSSFSSMNRATYFTRILTKLVTFTDPLPPHPHYYSLDIGFSCCGYLFFLFVVVIVLVICSWFFCCS